MLGEEDAATDASFQKDPEHYQFTCLSEEEVWNYLDMQVRDLARDLKVGVRGGEDECGILLPPSLSMSLSLPLFIQEDVPVARGLLHSLQWDQIETKKR